MRIWSASTSSATRHGLEPYANPRTSRPARSSCSIRNSAPSAGSGCSPTATARSKASNCPSHRQLARAAQASGAFPSIRTSRSFDDIEKVIDYSAGWEKRLGDLPYETDGLVIKVDSFEQRERLGNHGQVAALGGRLQVRAGAGGDEAGRHRGAVGKNGMLTPTAHLGTVQLAGTRVSRASLHNADYIRGKDIRIGDTVVVIKAGKIIPYILRAEPGLRTGTEKVFAFPEKCPVCGSAVKPDDKEGLLLLHRQELRGPAQENAAGLRSPGSDGHRRAGGRDDQPAGR